MPSNITPAVTPQDTATTAPDHAFDIPEFLLIANRRPLTPEQRTHAEAAIAAARVPAIAQDNLRVKQRERARERSRVRIEKMMAKKTGAAAQMPLSGKAALAAIRRARATRR